MSNKIDSNFGAGIPNFDQSKTRESKPSSRNFGEFLGVDDRDDEFEAQAEASGGEQEETQSGGFGSIFGNYNSSRNQDYERDDSTASHSSSKRTESYRPGHEHKAEHKPGHKPKLELDKDGEKSLDEKPQKVKDIKQNEPMAAFQVPMQVDRMPIMPTAAVEKTAPVMPPQMLDQIVQDVRLGVNANGLAEFQFDLKSDVLDGLKLKISTKDGQVNATFIAENIHVKDAIDQGAQELIKALQARGLEVANIQVNVGADSQGQSGGGQQQQQNQQHQQQHYSGNNDYYADNDRGGVSRDIASTGKDGSNTDYTI